MKDKSRTLTVVNTGKRKETDIGTSEGGNVSISYGTYGGSGAYLSKVKNDTAKGLITFEQGISIAGVIVRKDENGNIFIDGNLILSGGVVMYADNELQDYPTIYDGLPIDGETIYWEEVKDEEGNVTGHILKAQGGGSGGSSDWANIQNKPSWITDTKPVYNFSEIQGTLTGYLPTAGGQIQGDLRLKADGSNYGNTLYFGDGSYCYLQEDSDDHLKIHASGGVNISTNYSLTVNGYSVLTTDSYIAADKLRTSRTLWGQSFDGTANVSGSLTGVGSITGTGDIDMGGDGTIDGNLLVGGGITMYSAKKLKNVVDQDGLTLEELQQIKPTRYTWKDKRDERVHIGGIADDVEQVLPEVIYKTSDGTLTMDYGNASFAIASSLVKPVVDHEGRLEEMERNIKVLEEEIKKLKGL